MQRQFKNTGDRGFQGNRPRFFKHRHRHGKPKPHFGLAEKDNSPKIPELPKDPPPAAYEANVFGKLDARLQYAIHPAAPRGTRPDWLRADGHGQDRRVHAPDPQ